MGDVEVEPRAFCMEALSIRRNFTERARRLNSRNAGIAARVFAPTASAAEPLQRAKPHGGRQELVRQKKKCVPRPRETVVFGTKRKFWK